MLDNDGGQFVLGVARRISREMVVAAENNARKITSATQRADQIISDALVKAAAIKQSAVQEWDDHQTKIRAIADIELEQFIKVSRVEANALALAGLLKAVRSIRDDFDEMTPWLQEFLRSALTKILGDLDADALWEKIIRQGLATTGLRWELRIRCSAEDQQSIHRAVSNSPDLHDMIKSVRSDDTMKAGDCILESASGAFDIGLETQISTLCQIVEQAKTEAPGPAPDGRQNQSCA